MIFRRLTAKTFLFGLALGTILFAVIVAGCARDAENRDGRDSDGATVSQGISERESGDSGGERGARSEDSEEHGTGGDGGGGESREAGTSSPIIPLGAVVERCPWRTGCFHAVRCTNQDRPRNGTKHALTETLLRAGRTSPEVRYEDGGRAWSREAGKPELCTGNNVKPVSRR